MNALTITENKALVALPATLQQYVSVRYKKPIKDYDNYELEKGMRDMIVRGYAIMGQMTSAADEGVIRFMREELLKTFRKPKYAMVTMEEISLFVSNGISGEYGSFQGQLNTMNVQNIIHWVKRGLESEDRKRALEEFNKIYLEQNTSPVPIQVKIQKSKEGIISAFDYYVKGEMRGDELVHRLPFCGFAYYDVLNDMAGVEYSANGKTFKTLITDPGARKKIVDGTIKAFKKELNEKKAKATLQKREDTVKGIEQMLSNLPEQKTLENRIKEKMLNWYFDKLIKEGKHVSEVLEEIKTEKI